METGSYTRIISYYWEAKDRKMEIKREREKKERVLILFRNDYVQYSLR